MKGTIRVDYCAYREMPLPTQSISTDLFKPGYKLGRYRLEEKLGRGGVGSVYRAVDESTGRMVALKTQEREDELVTTLFEREYHTLASLRHPCVIEVFDFAVGENGRRYYTMELLEGQDLNTLSPLPWKAACEHLRDVATSLALLHARRSGRRLFGGARDVPRSAGTLSYKLGGLHTSATWTDDALCRHSSAGTASRRKSCYWN